MNHTLKLALLALAMSAGGLAAADGEKLPRASSRAASAAHSASAPASAAERRATPGNKQHQLLGKCNQQLDAAKLTGAARKKAMSDCLRNS